MMKQRRKGPRAMGVRVASGLMLTGIIVCTLSTSAARGQDRVAAAQESGYLAGTLYNWEQQKFERETPAKCVVVQAHLAVVLVNDISGIGRGTGFFVSKNGHLITNAHVATRIDRPGQPTKLVQASWMAKPIAARILAVQPDYDLALLQTEAVEGGTPFLEVAASIRPGESVFCIGCPGRFDEEQNIRTRTWTNVRGTDEEFLMRTFHYSQGVILGLQPGAKSERPLGSVENDAWTYWGHSGSPLLNYSGRVVAVHNSWNESTRHRHAVSNEHLKEFLGKWMR